MVIAVFAALSVSSGILYEQISKANGQNHVFIGSPDYKPPVIIQIGSEQEPSENGLVLTAVIYPSEEEIVRLKEKGYNSDEIVAYYKKKSGRVYTYDEYLAMLPEQQQEDFENKSFV